MLVIGGIVLGAVIGASLARIRGGKPADMAQYAAGLAILFGILGVFATIATHRMLAG